jgi:hypothetical protein
MAVNNYGFDPARNRWSNDAVERLFPKIAQNYLSAQDVVFAWSDNNLVQFDTHYGTDAILTTDKQRNIAIAIRIRGLYYYNRFGDITIRFDSLQTIGKMLEMSKSIARFLFFAWVDTDRPKKATKFVDWHVIWLQRLVDKFMVGELVYSGPFDNNDDSSRLIGINIQELERHNLIYTSSPIVSPAKSIDDWWPQLLVEVRQVDRISEALLRNAEPICFNDETLSLEFLYPFHTNKFLDLGLKKHVEQIINQMTGRTITLICTTRNSL